jgi:xanthine/CO dehydrogenase XdhC/CoxF family maturation factor
MAGPGACYTDADLEGKKKDSIYHQVKEFLDKGETLAVATIVSTKGSTPREVGAKMVVTAWGEILGTIGGGCGEADVKREAIEVIRTRKPRTVRVDLLDDISSDSPAVCGGIMNVFIDPWWSEREREAAAASK